MDLEHDLRRASTRSIFKLTLLGWLLVLVSVAVVVLVAVLVGAWALETIPRKTVGGRIVVCLLAIPSIVAGVATFLLGSRALRRLGLAVWRSRRVDRDHSSRRSIT